jgi:hypothetical protein
MYSNYDFESTIRRLITEEGYKLARKYDYQAVLYRESTSRKSVYLMTVTANGAMPLLNLMIIEKDVLKMILEGDELL